jgi:hypothetical protein
MQNIIQLPSLFEDSFIAGEINLQTTPFSANKFHKFSVQ